MDQEASEIGGNYIGFLPAGNTDLKEGDLTHDNALGDILHSNTSKRFAVTTGGW